MEIRNYIIGGGVTGLIFAYYNPEYTIISPDVGGQLSNANVSPMYLHVNEFTTKLLEDLFIEKKVKKIRIGFLNEKCEIVNEINNKQKKIYFAKSRGLDKNSNFQVPGTALNQDKTTFDAYNVDWQEIIKRIITSGKVKILKTKVKNIDTKNKIIELGGIHLNKHYNELISTCPLYNLMDLMNKPANELNLFEKTSATIIYQVFNYEDLTEIEKEIIDEARRLKYNYLYDINEDTYSYRITLLDDGRVTFEYIAESSIIDDDLKCEIIKVPYGKIIHNMNFEQIDGVKLLGRYAQINQRIKTETICEVAQKWN